MYFERSYIWFAIEIAFTLVKSEVIPRIVDYTHFSILCSLVHTVTVFFRRRYGVDTAPPPGTTP